MSQFLYELWMFLCLCPVILGVGFCWPCCGTNCEICSDNWDSVSNGTDVSTGTNCGWTEVVGDWDVTSHRMRATPSFTDALCISNTPHPDGFSSVRVSATVRSSSAFNPGARVVLDYIDASNYVFAQIHFDFGYLRIYKRVGGTNTMLDEVTGITYDVDTNYTLTICAETTGHAISATDSFGNTVKALWTLSSPDWGVGASVGTGSVSFDNVTAEQTEEAGCSCPISIPIQDTCCDDGDDLPPFLLATLSGITGSNCCTDLDGEWYIPHQGGCSYCLEDVPTCGCFTGSNPGHSKFVASIQDGIGNQVLFYDWSGDGACTFTTTTIDGNILWTLTDPLDTCCPMSPSPVSLPWVSGTNCVVLGVPAAPCDGSSSTVTMEPFLGCE